MNAGIACCRALLLIIAGWAAWWGSIASAMEVRGSYRNLPLGEDVAGRMRYADLNRLRLEGDADTGLLHWHLAWDHDLIAGSLVNTPAFRAAARLPYPTYADLDARIVQRGLVDWRHRLYRGWVAYDSERLLLKLGRQRVAWGTGRLWNPTDRFNPVSPVALEPEEKVGVDGLMAAWRYSGSGALQWALAPGRASRGVPRRSVLRIRDTLGGADLSLLAGRIGAEAVIGGDVAADLWDGGLHAEVLYARRVGGASWTQAVAGYEYTLTGPRTPSGLYLLIEYFYNGAAGRADVPPSGDRLSSRVRHQLGFAAGYDLTPLWRLEVTAIADMVKGSAFVSPRLKWSVKEDVDLSLFGLLFGGHAGSEFGDRANVYAAQLDVFF